MKIKLLSETTINRIAAGEVVERPASVVKELVENAIDAGATKVVVTLEAAGKNLIIVSDDGCGMTQAELEMAIQRHTTSKLDESDLLNINTFGFRGEALPSIASISKMSITSKPHNSDKAFQIQLIGGTQTSIKYALHNIGTRIEVRDIFFATPARLKFLRSDNTELSACMDCIKKIALAYPNIEFSLSHEGKSLFKVRQQEQSLSPRVSDVLGESFIPNAAELNLQHDGLSIKGYVSIPTLNRATAGEQFFFVNNRAIKDKILSTALRIAYQDYLTKDRHPIVVIFLQIDPQLVDVNVHPAKNEVRFQEPDLIRKSLIKAIKDALSQTSHQTSTTIADTAINLFVQSPLIAPRSDAQNHYTTQQYKVTEADNEGSYRHTNLVSDLIKKTDKVQNSKLINTIPQTRIQDGAEDNDHRLGAVKAQLLDSYIIAQTNDSLVIIDQHAADERLQYEKIKAQYLANNDLLKQRLLIPEIVELNSEFQVSKLFAHIGRLSELGFTLEKFGGSSIIVSEIPSLLGDINVQQLISDLAEHITETDEQLNVTQLIEHITETYACHHAIRAGRKLSIAEMNELLRQMEKTPFSGQCNHGRPTYIELKFKDIEKLFGRR